MTRQIKILSVHGVGGHPPGGDWEKEWKDSIQSAFAQAGIDATPSVSFVHHDAIFKNYPLTFLGTLEAVGKLLMSAATAPFRAARGGSGSLRWTAGMVVQWVENEELRRKTRDLLFRRISEENPDVICGHSLGSLIAYDTFTHPDTRGSVKNRTFISLGSQIGNPFVSGNFLAGRIEPLPASRFWYHLYNSEDAVFAAPLHLHADNFMQVETYFDEPGMADHSAPRYLAHPQAAADAWWRIGHEFMTPGSLTGSRGAGATEVPAAAGFLPATGRKASRRRALLVGINDYPKADMKLEGCVNDVYLMSSLLQESGFDADDIRIVLDGRATADAVRERLEWLLEDISPSGEGEPDRVFYFSGHGAQMPGYGLGDKVDRTDEALVPYDFDWTAEHAITDDYFFQLYSQLPYSTRFLTIFDCCHSGGMTRGPSRVRGITPPDDIRHRELRWDAEHEMWVARAFSPRIQTYASAGSTSKTKLLKRSPGLGTFQALRLLPDLTFEKLRKARGHRGPYLPLLLYACREDEFAYEYRHGNTPHGAFTYSLVKRIRAHCKSAGVGAGDQLTFRALVDAVGMELDELGYEQHPLAVGPRSKLKAQIPLGRSTPAGATPKARSGR